jgi:hypothetical protein
MNNMSFSRNKRWVCKSIYGPYSGPFSNNIITYFLYDDVGNKILWHSGPNKDLKCNLYDVLNGIVVDKGIINYKKSYPNILTRQLSIF